jgi:hypothetical protein
MLFKTRNLLPKRYYEILPDEYKLVKYKYVDNMYYFGINKGYSYKIEEIDGKLILRKSGLNLTGNIGIGNIAQGLNREKIDSEVIEIGLKHENTCEHKNTIKIDYGINATPSEDLNRSKVKCVDCGLEFIPNKNVT